MIEVTEKRIWQGYLKEVSGSVFLLEWWWGEFQKIKKCVPYRFVWKENGKVKAVVQVFFQPLFCYVGYMAIIRCPLYASDVSEEEQASIESELINWCKQSRNKQKSLFVRFEPLVPTQHNFFAHTTNNRQPQTTLMLDVSCEPEALLQSMHEKTRYNIRLSLKKDLVCEIFSVKEVSEKLFKTFWDLMEETTTRVGINSYEEKYYKRLFGVALAEEENNIFLTRVLKENKTLASGLFIGSGDTITYLYGASSNQDRNSMAPYFMHWKMIEFARAHGYKRYDWWGINPKDSNESGYKKTWEGITRFKEGFGGTRVVYPQAQEIPINLLWYRIYKLIRKIL